MMYVTPIVMVYFLKIVSIKLNIHMVPPSEEEKLAK